MARNTDRIVLGNKFKNRIPTIVSTPATINHSVVVCPDWLHQFFIGS